MRLPSARPLKLVLVAAVGLFVAEWGTGAASAAVAGPTPALVQKGEAAPLVDEAHSRRYRRPAPGYYPRRYGRRYRYRPYGWRYAPPRYRPRYRPRAAPTYNYRGHVRWCLNRYRSYNPRTDQYLGYDGYYHRCRSPY